MNQARRWHYATLAAVLLWLAFVVRLMIADVWDETNGMLAFSSPAMTFGAKLQFVLTQSLGFWRPLPTLLVATILHFVRDFDLSWRVLRGVNICMLLATLWLLRSALWRTGNPACPPVDEAPSATATEDRQDCLSSTLFTAGFLFSASAIITAGWFANVFDASAMLLIAFALSLLLRGRDLAAGVTIGIAFFCKESAALALPFLLVLLASGRITFRQTLRAGIPAAILGAIYFAIRSRIVPFGGEGDIHGFAAAQLAPTFLNLAESFWEQTLKWRGFLGYLWLAVSIAALRRPRLIAAALLFFCATGLIYWGMFGEYQNGVLIHHLDFVGRLYLVPATLMLFLLALERRTIAIAILLLPIVFGGFVTYRDHARFQRMYKRIYRTARQATVKPLTVHYPAKPLDDVVRGVKVGDIPDASVTVNATTGRLGYR
ncbi:MAG TPA: hypothetical protein VF846_00900 [Thermoanaerobaculia bacterium]|jgi:hypothetical protein